MAKRVAADLAARLVLETTPFEEGVNNAKKITGGLEKDIDGKVDKISEKLKKIGLGLSASVTLPLTLFAKQSLDTFTNFEQSMQNTFSVMGASASEMEALRQKAEEMGASTRFSASQAADALYSLGSAGQNAAQAAKSLDGVLKLAGATGSDLAFTSETITSTLSQFNLQADKAAHIADVYSMAISKSQANMTKLSYSMKYVGPIASGLNIKLETATAALMRLYNTGYGGEMAGTYLRAGLQKLASGTDEFKTKLAAIGLTYDEVNPKTNDLADIIERLKEKQINVNKANELFGNIVGGAMFKLIEGGGEAIRTMDGLLQASDGAAEKMQEIQNASFANTKAELNSAWEAVQITLTSNIIPAVDTFAKGITAVLKAVNDMPVGLQITLQGFMGIAASAGPLLLVAANVTKIKKAWATLNAVMAANPILIWGAAIAAAGAVAMGIIAQVRKSHEDYIHGAKKGVEEVKKLQEDAKKSGDEGRKIQSLFAEYKKLKDKTKGAGDEQARYNQLLIQLKELVPGVTMALNEYGQEVIANEEALKEAALIRIQTEKTLNNLALAEARTKAQLAKAVAISAEKEKAFLDEELKSAQENLNKVMGTYNKLQAIDSAYQQIESSGDKKAIEAFKDKLWEHEKMTVWGVRGAILEHEDMIKSNAKRLEKVFKRHKEVTDLIKENIEAGKELKAVYEKKDALDAAEKELQKPKTAPEDIRKAKLEELKAAWKEYLEEKIHAEAAEARANGEAFNEDKAKFEFLKNYLKQLREITGDDGLPLFNADSKELQPWVTQMWKFKENSEKSPEKEPQKDNSYQAQIEALDKYWQERISKAKEYGQDENEVRKQHYKERLEFIENAIKQEKETGEKTETKKGSGVTLGDELKKTALMGLDGFGKYILQQKELRAELEKTQEEIIATQNKIAQTKAQIEAAEKEGKSGTETEALNQELQAAQAYAGQLEEKAQSLRVDINEAEFSLKDIDKTLSDLENSDKSKYQLKLINIEDERKRIHQTIDEWLVAAKQGAKDTEEIKRLEKEAAEKKAKADSNAENEKQAETASVANTYLQGAISIAQSLTDVIAKSIEQGGLDGFAALEASGQILGQIGSMIEDEIAKAVLGSLSAIIGMTSKILGAVKRKNEEAAQKAREEAKQFNDEIRRQQEENAQNAVRLAGEAVRNIAKLTAGRKINADTIFDTQALDVEKKRIEKAIEEIQDLKTEAEYTFQQENTREVNSKWGPLGWFKYDNYTETYYTTETANYTVAEVLEKYNEAMRNKDYAAAKQWKDFATKAINKGLKEAGINSNNADSISDYIGSLDSTLAGYVKTRDMNAFKKALKEQLYEALINKAVANVMSKRISQIFDKIESGSMTYEEGMKQIENIGDETVKMFDQMNKKFGAAADRVKKEWEEIGNAISTALSSALADSAYNADWGAFKKSFAGEMKKAVIQSAVESAGLKKKVDAIIKAVMEDGKITTDEITGAVKELQPLYDEMEKMLSEFANITKGLEGGSIEVKSQTSGHIIQQLSGADRDVLLEAIKNGFKTINQSIDLKDATIQHLAATQVIINAVTFNSYNGTVYIQANENTNLTALVTEVVERVMAG